MEHQDELYLLIKSLTKGEKKFFSQYVNLYEKSSSHTYSLLFDFLNNEDSYSEERVFKKFRDPLFRKNYSVTKHYLKNLIIKTLRHSELTFREDRDLTVYLVDIKRLMAKGLFGMAKKMIEKLKADAYNDEKFLDVINTIAMQRGLISMGYYKGQPEINLDALDKEEELLFEKIKQLRNLMNSSIKLFGLMNYELGENPDKVTKEIEALGQMEGEEHFDELQSAKAKHSYLQFHTLYHCALGNYPKYLEYANKKLEFVRHEKLPPTVSNWLILAYNHCLSASLLSNELGDMEQRLHFLEGMELHSHFHDADRFQAVSMYGLLYSIKINDEVKIRHYVTYSLSGIQHHAAFIRTGFVYTLRSTVAYAYLKLKDFDKCMDEINELLSLTGTETRKDYVGHVKLINVMLRYEMEDYMYLTNLLKNTYRFFSHSLYTSPVHLFVIGYLKDALKTKHGRNETELKRLNLDKLRQLRYNPKEADLALMLMMEDHLRGSK